MSNLLSTPEAQAARRTSVSEAATATAATSVFSLAAIVEPEGDVFDRLVNARTEAIQKTIPSTQARSLDDIRAEAVALEHRQRADAAVESVRQAGPALDEARRTLEQHEADARQAPAPALTPPETFVGDRMLFKVAMLLERQEIRQELAGLSAAALVAEVERAETFKDKTRAYVADQLARRAVDAIEADPSELALSRGLAVEQALKLSQVRKADKEALQAKLQRLGNARMSPKEREQLASLRTRVAEAQATFERLRPIVLAAQRTGQVAVKRPAGHVERAPLSDTLVH